MKKYRLFFFSLFITLFSFSIFFKSSPVFAEKKGTLIIYTKDTKKKAIKAPIYVDSEYKGTKKVTLKLSPGRYLVEFGCLDGYTLKRPKKGKKARVKSGKKKRVTGKYKKPTNSGTPSWIIEDGVRLQASGVGLASGSIVADVSVVRLPDDTYRAYFYGTGRGVMSATSSDGLTFTVEQGSRMPDGNGMPRVVALGNGSYRLFFNMFDGIGSAISSDGINFTEESGTRIKASDFGEYSLTGGSLVTLCDGTYRMYFSDLPLPDEGLKAHKVYSAVSSDMLNWIAESGVRVGSGSSIDKSAEHPFVIKKTDGTFRMFFYNNSPTAQWTATSSDGDTWKNAKETGITKNLAEGNDPDVVVLPNGKWRIYYGDFDSELGGLIYSAVGSEY